jgi:hypothetical protein
MDQDFLDHSQVRCKAAVPEVLYRPLSQVVKSLCS